MRVAVLGIILVSLIFLTPLFKAGFYESHDGEAHVARFAAYYRAYSDGQFPPRWAGGLNQGFGSPVFIFYYPLPGTLASVLHFFNIGFEDSFKILMIISFTLSSVSFYLWIEKKVRKEMAILGGFLYGLAPYHFLNTYVRGDIAETIALSLVPLVFLFIDKTSEKASWFNILTGGILYALLILSHNAISLMFSAIYFAYIILFQRAKRSLITTFSLLGFGLLSSCFFWLPALYESRFTNAALFIGDMYKNHFPSLTSLIYSPWGFGPDINSVDELSPQIGPIHVAIVLLGTCLIFIKRKFNREFIFWIFIFTFAVLLTTSVSTFLWEKLPLLKLFQFPWRITALSSFTASVVSILVLNRFYNKKLLILIAVFLIFLSFPLAKVEESLAKTDDYYQKYKGTTYYHGQASSIWTAGDPGEEAKQPIEVIAGEAAVSDISRKSNRHTFEVDAKTEARILDNTIYFPGWQVNVDREKTPIEFQDPNHRGLITFSVPQGVHSVEVKFGESPIRLLSDIISLISLLSVMLAFIFRKRIHTWYQYYRVL